MAVITISREPGTGGEEIAARLAGKLGFLLVDKHRLSELWREIDLDESKLFHIDEDIPSEAQLLDDETEAFIRVVPDLLVQLAEEHDLVVIGRGSQGLFRDRPGTLHVRIVGSRKFRIQQLQSHEGLSAREARRRLRQLEDQRSRYIRFLYRLKWTDPNFYDLVLRMDHLSIEQALNFLESAVKEMRLLQVPKKQIVEDLLPESIEEQGDGRFANESEREFAHFLEFYRIPYEYEPRTFILETDENGKIAEAFTPDFYLPEQDLYIELTTMRQSLVTRKNRKVRKLRRLYPEINIRIFYQRDFQSLLAKYGLLTDRSDTGAIPDKT
ncbi:MAG: cytidylate kinase family protein [Desulfoferrobacter sp.]